MFAESPRCHMNLPQEALDDIRVPEDLVAPSKASGADIYFSTLRFLFSRRNIVNLLMHADLDFAREYIVGHIEHTMCCRVGLWRGHLC